MNPIETEKVETSYGKFETYHNADPIYWLLEHEAWRIVCRDVVRNGGVGRMVGLSCGERCPQKCENVAWQDFDDTSREADRGDSERVWGGLGVGEHCRCGRGWGRGV